VRGLDKNMRPFIRREAKK